MRRGANRLTYITKVRVSYLVVQTYPTPKFALEMFNADVLSNFHVRFSAHSWSVNSANTRLKMSIYAKLISSKRWPIMIGA